MSEDLTTLLDGSEQEVDGTPEDFEDSEDIEAKGEDGADPDDYDAPDPDDKKPDEGDVEPVEAKPDRKQSESVPYSRFKEVNDEKNTALEDARKSADRMHQIIEAQQESNRSQAQQQDKADIPDPDYEPEQYTEYWKNKEADITAREQVLAEQATLSDEDQRVNVEVQKQERAFNDEQPDYYQVVQQGREAAINHLRNQYQLERNPNADQLARQRVDEYMGAKTREIIARGGDVAAYAYQEAKGYIGSVSGAEGGEENGQSKIAELEASNTRKTSIEQRNKSIASSGSAVPDLSEMDIDDMNDEQFQEYKTRLFQQNDPLRA